ncbi:MAG: hypothetical protein U0W24_01775 [Bacteroidales bacterium]
MKKTVSVLVLTTFFIQLAYSQNIQTNVDLNWELSQILNKAGNPDKWIKAIVPGAVQLDFARALNYGPYYYAENWKNYLWMEDQSFQYRAKFKKPDLKENQKCIFYSKGIDYEFDIVLNGEKIYYQEGMFTPVELDITSKLKVDNELLIKIYPVPKLHKFPADRSQAAQCVKPAVSYGWDWHPRLIPVGIWDETGIILRNKSEITSFSFDYQLDKDLKNASFIVNIEGTELESCRYLFQITNESENNILKKEGECGNSPVTFEDSIFQVKLWWPHDQGKQYLYTVSVKILDKNGSLIDQKTIKTGFRQVKLVMNEGAWNGPEGFPKSRSIPPIQLEINGRPIFAKGTNWVNPEIFPGIITKERYNELLDRAKEANFNLLRIWGGGIVNKESFYELCDEKGIMVWQEFPLACNNYEGTPHYLKILKQESASIIKKLKPHPCLAIWCGGNELFNNWSRMTDQSLALRLLNSQCYELDPNTPFLPTSPVMGMGHGHYVFRDFDSKEEVFQWMQKAHNSAYTEFGVPSPSSVEILKIIIPSNELWPPKPGTSWESHHAFKAWVGNTWLMADMLKDYFGEAQNLEELVNNGQLVQSEGYKCIYEEARRQKPYCSMALNWCFNEPWPTAANNSIVNWPNIPKPGFYAVKNACRPLLASARINKFKYTEGEEFKADIWILNDKYEDIKGGKMTLKIKNGKEEIVLLNWDYPDLKPNKNLHGPSINYVLPAWETDRFKLILEVEGHPEMNSDYTLLYQPGTVSKKRNVLNF